MIEKRELGMVDERTALEDSIGGQHWRTASVDSIGGQHRVVRRDPGMVNAREFTAHLSPRQRSRYPHAL